MKVLAILGSPRREGNGTKLVQQIEARMKALGDVEFEYLHLVDEDLKMCRGCFACISKGESHCPLKDARVGIEQRIEAADGIILVSPGYVQNVSGLMKNFMDRMAYTNHRPRFFGKKMMLVANGGAGLDKTLDALRIAIAGPEIVSEVAWVQLPWPTHPKYEAKKVRKLDRAVLKFYRSIDEGRQEADFGSYLRFRFFKDVSASTGKWLPADSAYYASKDGYYCNAKVGLGSRLCAPVVMAVGKLAMRGMAPFVQEGGSKDE